MSIDTLYGCECRTLFCWICGNRITLEDSKTDEEGRAVHEDCYVILVAMKKAQARNAA